MLPYALQPFHFQSRGTVIEKWAIALHTERLVVCWPWLEIKNENLRSGTVADRQFGTTKSDGVNRKGTMRRSYSFPSFASTATRNFLVGTMLCVYEVVAIAQVQVPAMTRLSGQTPKLVIDGTATLIGRYSPNQMLRLVIALQPPHPAEEEQFLRDLQRKDSPEFQHFLTAEQWNARFAPSAQDEQAVVDWAASRGLTVTHRYPNRLLVDVEAPVSTIEKALAIEINNYQLGATSFFSNDQDPMIPNALSGIIRSVGGLNNREIMRPGNRSLVVP